VRIPAATTNIRIPALTSRYFRKSIVVLLSAFLPGFGYFRGAGKYHAEEAPENEFFDQDGSGH
jgi:hypothetical protein